MGNQKLRWTSDEEKALFAGVEKYGTGRWKTILMDPLFATVLLHRSNIDLKDKWRNLSVSAGHGSREKSRIPEAKTDHIKTENPAPNLSNAAVDDEIPNSPHDRNNAQRLNELIFEALSTMRDPNGSDFGAICNFVEQRLEPPVPQNLRRLLGTRLRRLVLQGKLEKKQNVYKVRTVTPILVSPTETSPAEQKVFSPRRALNFMPENSEVQMAVDDAAYRIAEDENMLMLAAEATMKVERAAKLEEEAEAMLELVKDIYVQCSEGEIIFLT